MVYRGSWTLAVTMILNPIILLFYQNCSYIPAGKLARGPASAIIPQVAYAEQGHSEPCNLKLKVCPQK